MVVAVLERWLHFLGASGARKNYVASDLLLFAASAISVRDPRDNSGCLPGEGMRLLGSEQARFEPDDDDNCYTEFLENSFGDCHP